MTKENELDKPAKLILVLCQALAVITQVAFQFKSHFVSYLIFLHGYGSSLSKDTVII